MFPYCSPLCPSPKFALLTCQEREARSLLANCLRSRNQSQKRPLATITFEQFAIEKWEPLALTTIQPSTARYYRFQLHKYLLPTFGSLRSRDLASLCCWQKATGLFLFDTARRSYNTQQTPPTVS